MNRPVPSYHDSSYFIHQRYEDTALLIFQKQQKLKQDAKKQAKNFPSLYREPGPGSSDLSDFSRYGNRGVVAKDSTTGNRLDDRPSVQSSGDGYANALDLYTKNSAFIKEVKYKIRCKRLGSEMELHPILETDTFPNAGLWYVLSGYGEYPSMRVGESCSYIPGKTENDNGRLYVIGGANPSGPFCDTYILDLNTQKWDLIDAPGFRARYEHAAFTPACHPNKIYIFGGADQTGNMNDVQVFDTDANTWSSVSVSGNPPSERTYHTSSATVGNKFIVYSGGHCGPDPVSDRQVHCFDATSLSWTTLNIKGDSPKPRHGHVTVAVGNKVFIHGGMAGANFYNDLHVLNLEKNTWSDVKRKRIYPSARAGHSAVAIGTNVYIFGGMNRDGALDELYKLDTVSLQWTRLDIQGPPPPCRLDFGMCVVELRRRLPTESTSEVVSATKQAQEVLEKEMAKPGSASSRSSCPDFAVTDSVVSSVGAEASSFPSNSNYDDVDGATAQALEVTPGERKMYQLCLIHGGMDTVGEVFDDVMVVNLDGC